MSLVVEGLSFSYSQSLKNSVEAIDGLSFKAGAGRMTALLGPNGSGKSTTFRIISTDLKIQKGTLSAFGVEITKDPVGYRSQLGVCFQNPSLDPHLTINENLKIAAALYGIKGAQATLRCVELLESFGLIDRQHERVKKLSGGLARRVELVKALLSNPKVILLDEPTTGLDPAARIDFWRQIKKLRDQGSVIFVTTHLMDEAEECDELLFISKGKIRGSGQPSKLRSSFGSEIVFAEGPEWRAEEQALRSSLEKLSDSIEFVGKKIRVQTSKPAEVMLYLQNTYSQKLENLQWSKPSLSDVYLKITGEQL